MQKGTRFRANGRRAMLGVNRFFYRFAQRADVTNLLTIADVLQQNLHNRAAANHANEPVCLLARVLRI